MAFPAVAQDSDMLERLRLLERRVTDLERQMGSRPYAEATEAAPKRTSAPPRGKSGWTIDVLPYVGEAGSGAPIMRKRVDNGPIFFNLHFEGKPNRMPVLYKGSALFEAKEDGAYTFNIAVDFKYHFRCEGSLSLDETPILSFNEIKVPQVVSGMIELRKGTYDIEHRVGCWQRAGKDRPLGTNRTDKTVKEINYSVRLLGPNDGAVRDFADDELFVRVNP